MADKKKLPMKKEKNNSKKLFVIITLELIVLLALFGTYRIYITLEAREQEKAGASIEASSQEVYNPPEASDELEQEELSPEEIKAAEEQEKLKQEEQEREQLIAEADHITLGYDYDAATELIKGYRGSQGSYEVYPVLTSAIKRLEEEKNSLVLYGGSYHSATEVNHIFFHSLVADTSLAFDGDGDSKGYNMYMATVSEFNKILQKLYEEGYVLVNMSDLVKKVTLEDGTTKYEEGEIYLREGKKPFVLSVDDVNYYPYMTGDGFASRIIVGEDGKATCEMQQADGTTVTGPFDVVPILDAFIEEHPDFSYQGAKGLLAITGYEGVLGYRTNDSASSTYEEDKEAAKKVVEVLKADGWEFGSHSWGHKNMQTESISLLKRDTDRWLEEVGPILGPTNIYVFPFGEDIETTVGTYSSDKYQFLKDSGFDIFLGVYKDPWMHIKKDYVRMTRRPIDGQAMLEFPDRLKDLFQASEILDPTRPAKNW